MERIQEHLDEDPILREGFIQQESWDEWAAVHTPFFVIPEARQIVENQLEQMGMSATYEDALAIAVVEWRATLSLETNLAEALYLQGYTHTERLQAIDQIHAEVLRTLVEKDVIPERDVDVDFRQQFGE